MSYFAAFNVAHTAADAAGSPVFAMHVPATASKRLQVHSIEGHLVFAGTAAAAGAVGYELIRFTVADPTTGTTVPRIRSDSRAAASIIADANIQAKSGILTLTGAVFEGGVLRVIRVPASVTGTVLPFSWRPSGSGFPGLPDSGNAIVLAPGEGLAIRVAAGLAAIIGQGLSGVIEWSEV